MNLNKYTLVLTLEVIYDFLNFFFLLKASVYIFINIHDEHPQISDSLIA